MPTSLTLLQKIEGDIVWVEKEAEHLGAWFISSAKAAANLYDKLLTREQQAITFAQGVVAIATKYINSDGALIIPIIQRAFPDFSLSTLQGILDIVLNNLKVVSTEVPLTLADALNELTGYLKQFTGDTFATETQGLANLITVALSPETPLQKVMSIAETVYQYIIKPLVVLL